MIRDLRIENYRLFRSFALDSLARVNLIVGTNNSGKSSLLEATYLLSSDDPSSTLLRVLDERGEVVVGSRYPQTGTRDAASGYDIAHIFQGHHKGTENAIRVRSEADVSQSLTLTVVPTNGDRVRQPSLFENESQDDADEQVGVKRLVLEYARTGQEPIRQSHLVSADGLIDRRFSAYRRGIVSPETKTRMITTSHLGYYELAALWDGITLTPREEQVIQALQILEPRVQRISFTSRLTSNSGILLKLDGEKEPVPLGSMGDGMRRVLAIAASLVSVENGTLLSDEIDTGLYYGIMTGVWRLILETAARQKAQVFATTHSWDCVKSFREALQETDGRHNALLIRLERKGESIHPVYYSKDELDIAIEQGIEVR